MTSLNGFWDFGFVGELEEYKGIEQVAFNTSLPVPGCFDLEPGLKLRRGIGAYRTRVVTGGNVTLRFEGLGPRAEIYWDGKNIGSYDLPFSNAEYRFDAGNEEEHSLIVAVDNRADDTKSSLFPGFYDFYRHGGIYRGVSIEIYRGMILAALAFAFFVLEYRSGYVIKLKTLLNALYFWRFFSPFFRHFFNKNALCCPSRFAHLRIA